MPHFVIVEIKFFSVVISLSFAFCADRDPEFEQELYMIGLFRGV